MQKLLVAIFELESYQVPPPVGKPPNWANKLKGGSVEQTDILLLIPASGLAVMVIE